MELDEGLESMIEIPRDQDNQLKAAMDVAVNGLEEAEKRVEESAAALEAEDCRRGAVRKTDGYTADGNGVCAEYPGR